MYAFGANWFCSKENSTTRRARGYLKQIYNCDVHMLLAQVEHVLHRVPVQPDPHHFLASRLIN